MFTIHVDIGTVAVQRLSQLEALLIFLSDQKQAHGKALLDGVGPQRFVMGFVQLVPQPIIWLLVRDSDSLARPPPQGV